MIDKKDLPVVTSAKLFTDNNFERIDEQGLFSQKIFGPIKSWRCACGFLRTKTLHAGQICPKCEVKCASNDLRQTSFAKIVLPFPVFKNTHKSRNQLQKIVNKAKYLIDPLQTDLSITTHNYLKINNYKDTIEIVDVYDPANCIPLKITGSYTLYLAILAVARILSNVKCESIIKNVFTYELLVTPPGTRFVFIKEENGMKQLISHDLNLFYSSLLRLSIFDWAHINDTKKNDNMYIDLIKANMGNPVPVENKELIYSDQLICKYQYYTDMIYDVIFTSLSGKDGYIRKDFLGKIVDFAARGHIVVDPSLRSYEIKIPKTVFTTLWFIEYLNYLHSVKNVHIDDIKPYIRLTENKLDEKYLKYLEEFIEYFFDETKVDYHKRLVIINRQPTLWRYGIPSVKVVGISEGNIICMPPLILEALGADFDGDIKKNILVALQ